MNRDVLDQWLERLILWFTLALLVIMPVTFGGRPQPPTGTSIDFLLIEPFVIAEWFAVALLGLWLARLLAGTKVRLLFPPVCWAVLAFTIYAVARYWTADIEYVARQEVLKVIVYAFVFFVLLNNLHRQESTQIIGFTLIVTAMALAFYALYQYLADSNRVWHLVKDYRNRGSGTFISPNHLGGFLEMILPLGLAYTLMGRFKPLVKVFLGYATAIVLAGLVVTMSRGAWLATLVALLFLFAVLLFHKPYRLHSLVALSVLLLAGAVVLPASSAFKARAVQVYSNGKVDDDARFSLWGPAVSIWREKPLWGAGPDHFNYRFAQYRPEQVQAKADRAHNDFLNTLADWGTAGALLVAAAWGFLVWGAVKTWQRVRKTPRDLGGSPNSNKTAFVIGAGAGLVAILAHSMVDFNMHIPANALLVVTLMSLLASHIRFATEQYWFTARSLVKGVLIVVLLGGISLLSFQAWKRTHESIWLAKAGMEPIHSEKYIAHLKNAFTVESKNGETARLLGEAYKYWSLHGTAAYEEQAREAISWFHQAMKLNPWDGNAPLHLGWCLDWLGRSSESGSYFALAETLNPNSYFTLANIGVHYVQVGDYAAARPFFERSLRLRQDNNPIAKNYLFVVNQRLEEAALRNAPKTSVNSEN